MNAFKKISFAIGATESGELELLYLGKDADQAKKAARGDLPKGCVAAAAFLKVTPALKRDRREKKPIFSQDLTNYERPAEKPADKPEQVAEKPAPKKPAPKKPKQNETV